MLEPGEQGWPLARADLDEQLAPSSGLALGDLAEPCGQVLSIQGEDLLAALTNVLSASMDLSERDLLDAVTRETGPDQTALFVTVQAGEPDSGTNSS